MQSQTDRDYFSIYVFAYLCQRVSLLAHISQYAAAKMSSLSRMPLHAIAALRADSRSIFIDRIKSLLLCKDNLLGGHPPPGWQKSAAHCGPRRIRRCVVNQAVQTKSCTIATIRVRALSPLNSTIIGMADPAGAWFWWVRCRSCASA